MSLWFRAWGKQTAEEQKAGQQTKETCHSGAGPPAWMHAYRDVGGRAASGTSRRGGRAASGTKAEESSGLYNPFPQRGNAIKGRYWVSLEQADRNGALPGPSARLPGFRPSPACSRQAGMTRGGFRLLPGGRGHPRRLVPDLPAAGRSGMTTGAQEELNKIAFAGLRALGKVGTLCPPLIGQGDAGEARLWPY